jgi:antitoxin HicB
MIELPAMMAAKTELYIAFKGSGIRKVELARRLGIPKTTVDRLFDFNNRTRLDQLEAAFRVLLGARQKLPSSAGIELPPLRTGSGNAGARVIIRAVGAQA